MNVKEIIKRMFIPTIMLIWAVCYYIEVLGKKASAGIFVKPVVWIMAVLYVLIGVKEVQEIRHAQKPETKTAEKNDGKVIDPELYRMLVCVGSAALYIFLMPYVGFALCTVVLLTGLFWWLKSSSRIGAFILALLVTAGIYLLFSMGLKVPLPAGFLGI